MRTNATDQNKNTVYGNSSTTVYYNSEPQPCFGCEGKKYQVDNNGIRQLCPICSGRGTSPEYNVMAAWANLSAEGYSCPICGARPNEMCCLVAHALHNAPPGTMVGIACPCPRCSPY